MKNLLLLFISTVTFLCVDAQVIQLGSGTSTNNIQTASPVNTYYRRQVCQFVYTVTEINAAGASGANILSQLGFYVTNQPVYAIPGYTIKIKHTTQNSVSNALGTTGWTTVKTAFSYSPNPGGYDMIVFDTPFNWNGTQNIGVEICWSQIQPSWDASGQCRIYNSSRGYRYSRDDNNGSICGNSPGTRNNNKPQAQLVFKTDATWNGSVNSDWFNNANWDIGTPDQELNEIIPSGPANMPSIGVDGAECKNLQINAGASLTIIGTYNIDIYRNWTNNGTFTANNGNVTLKGTAANSINGANNQDLYNLTVDNVNGATISSGSININGTLDIGIATGNCNTNNAITIISNASGTGRIDELTSKCMYTLDMSDTYGDSWNGGYITVLIDGIVEGTYFAKGSNSTSNFIAAVGATVQLNYTAGIYEFENSYILYDGTGSPIFSDGTTPAIGTNVFSTTSNCSFFNPISGNITMQRYIDAGATDWRFITSPVSGATLAEMNDDFVTSGFPGAQYPNWPSAANPWPSIYSYDETIGGIVDNGFNPATNITNPMTIGVGYWVYSGDTSIGTQPFTIDITGPPNVGNINLPLTYTNSGMPTEDGWNMVGNPYPSTLDWDSPNITKAGLYNAIYIWNPDLQQFASYSGGIGTNGGSRNIASSQAIWVQATSALASIQVTESSKTAIDGSFLKPSQVFPLRIKAQNSFGIDELAINFENSATNSFDENYDARKMTSVNTNLPIVSSITNGVDFSINQLPTQEIDIPIKILTGVSGLHNIEIENVASFSNSTCLILEDLFTGAIYDLNTITSFTTYIYDSTTTARFLLHIGAPYEVNVIDVSCNGNTDAKVIYSKNSSSAFDITWKNGLGNTISSNTNIFTDSIVNVPAGTYTIETTDVVCGNATETIIVAAPNVITSFFNTTTDTIYLSNGGNISFNNQSANATDYFWDFNDGTNSIVHSPIHSYTIAGDYLVNLTASISANCSANYNKLITVVGNATGIDENENNNTVNAWISSNVLTINLAQNKYDFIELRNVLGQIIYSENNPSNTFTLNVSEYSSSLFLITLSSLENTKVIKVPYVK
ncbi:MAG: PKD domain-containing protein [Flavobacteriales bacterium]|nr:PKD domain-containing protein [Flavobacteriales bacterium]